MFVKNITETTQKIRIDWVETEIGAWEVFQTTEGKAEELIRNYPSIIGYADAEDISWSGDLSELNDVEITNPTDWQVLSFDETSEKWKNKEVEADSSNVSYRWMSVEQALDIANPLVENIINEDTEMVNWFWQKNWQGNPEFNPATSGGLSDFVSFYIPVTEWETLYIWSTMNALWGAYLDANKQPLYVWQFSGSKVTIPTGQNIAYFSYPMRYGGLPAASITRTPAQFNWSVDVYRMDENWETKLAYPTTGRINNSFYTNMSVEATNIWKADYTYDFDNNVFGMGNWMYVLWVNTVDNTAIALNMNTKIYIFNLGLGTYVDWTYEILPDEWKKNLSQRKSPSRFCGCSRADDENNYILRSEWLSDLIIPKADIKTFVEANGKVFNNYTSVSGMVYLYGNPDYKYKSIYSVRHTWPLVEKKVEVEVDSHWANKTWYAYGTSMTDTTMNGYTVELQSLLGANLTNYGKGWSGIIPSLHGGTSGDNTYTRVKRTSDGKTNADLITLEIIPNDMSGTLGTPTDNYADGTTETFCGCLNELLQYLQVNTNAQIVVLIATKSRYQYQHPETTYPPESENATKWIEWTDAAKECCRRNCVPFIDGQSNCGLGYARVIGNNRYVQDQIHLTPLGAKNLWQYFYSQIKNIPLFYSA